MGEGWTPMNSVLRVFGKVTVATLVATGTTVVGSVVVPQASPAFAQAASSIQVRGNQRIDAETVRSYFRPGAGERLDSARIDEGIRNLYSSGLVQDVRVTRSGGGIVVTVVENAVINRVAFEGNSRVKDAVLEAEVQSRARGPFSRELVQADVQRILEVYRRQGRAEATVEPVTISQPNGRVDLVFQINEASKTKISSIEFEGNEAYGDGRLRDVMTTTESNFLSWLKTSDIYDPDRINADLELLRQFYLNRGYADFRVISSTADFDAASNSYTIRIVVEEGERYRFAGVDIESTVPDVDADSLNRLVRTSEGDVYSAQDVEKSVEAMSVELATRGYAFAQVRPRGARDYENRTVSVVYSVEEGSRVYVERINIRGNTRTRDYVVRREFDIAEGDAYNQAIINRAERRLNNLGFFKGVRISSEPGSSPDRVIVNVDVEDQPTGEFSIAGGYSSSDGLIAEVGVAEKNFLGRGQYIKVGAQLGERSQGVDFSFTEPYFLGRRLSAGIDLYWKDQNNTRYSSYDLETRGGALRFGLPITDNLQFGVNYQLFSRNIQIKEDYKNCLYNPGGGVVDANCFNDGEASIALKASEGENVTSQIGYAIVWNSLDNNLNPTNGWRAEFRQDLAGLGGDSEFLRTTADVRYYHELPADAVGFIRVQGGHVWGWGDELRILDQFFMGPDLVRGFAPSGIGPRDRTGREDPLGGTTYVGATAEVQFPLFGVPREFGLKGAVFADAGTLFDYNACNPCTVNGDPVDLDFSDDNALRSSVGVSLLWQSPLGPLRFDYAYVLSSGRDDEEQAFRFSGGARF